MAITFGSKTHSPETLPRAIPDEATLGADNTTLGEGARPYDAQRNRHDVPARMRRTPDPRDPQYIAVHEPEAPVNARAGSLGERILPPAQALTTDKKPYRFTR
jgi:hypothetical protein